MFPYFFLFSGIGNSPSNFVLRYNSDLIPFASCTDGGRYLKTAGTRLTSRRVSTALNFTIRVILPVGANAIGSVPRFARVALRAFIAGHRMNRAPINRLVL